MWMKVHHIHKKITIFTILKNVQTAQHLHIKCNKKGFVLWTCIFMQLHGALHCCSTQTGFTFILLMRQNVQICSKFYFKKKSRYNLEVSHFSSIQKFPFFFFYIFRQAKNGGIKNSINLIRNKKEKKWHLATKLFFYYSNEKKKTRIKKRPPCHLVPDFNTMCVLCILKQMLFT